MSEEFMYMNDAYNIMNENVDLDIHMHIILYIFFKW